MSSFSAKILEILDQPSQYKSALRILGSLAKQIEEILPEQYRVEVFPDNGFPHYFDLKLIGPTQKWTLCLFTLSSDGFPIEVHSEGLPEISINPAKNIEDLEKVMLHVLCNKPKSNILWCLQQEAETT